MSNNFISIALIAIAMLAVDVLGALTMLGADVSSLPREEELHHKYYNSKGHEENALDILKEIGVNYIRLRIWNNPSNKLNNKDKVLQFAKVVKAKKLKLMIDFHYSDTWADPAHQITPHEWVGHDIHKLEKDVYDYTHDVCMSLKQQGTVPDSVQIGNEINTGMCWPEGKVVSNDFKNIGALLKSGIKAIKDCNKETQTIIHTALIGSDGAKWFYDGIKGVGVDWDIIAQSYYSFWHGNMTHMQKVVSELKSRYNKPVVIVETAYNYEGNPLDHKAPIDGYPSTQKGQAQNFHDVQKHARDGGAIGVFYWEPTWFNGHDPSDSKSTNYWDPMAIFNHTGHLNPYFKWEA